MMCSLLKNNEASTECSAHEWVNAKLQHAVGKKWNNGGNVT